MTSPRKRVLLFFPVFSHVFPAPFENFLRLVLHAGRNCPEYDFDPLVLSRSSVHSAMNSAVECALLNGHDYLVAFDDDCLPSLIDFPKGDAKHWQVIPRLLALGEKGFPIVGGIGYMRGYPHTMTAGRFYPWGTTLVLGQNDASDAFKGFYWLDSIEKHKDELNEDGLLRVDFCGVPIICIHKSVLQKIQQPLFETRDEAGGQSTHDVNFCNKATAAGFKIYVDSHIDCGHVIEAPIINRDTKKALLGLGIVEKPTLMTSVA